MKSSSQGCLDIVLGQARLGSFEVLGALEENAKWSFQHELDFWMLDVFVVLIVFLENDSKMRKM